MWDKYNCVVVWAFSGIAFLWDWNENWPFPVLWPLLFSKFADILSATLQQHHLLGFEIAQLWFPSLPLALFIVMLPKAHLTLHSRMSGSRWVITPLCYDQMLQVKKLTSAFYDGQCVLSNVMQIYVHACVLGGGRKEKRFSWQHIDPNQESTSSLKTVWSLCSGPLRPRSLQLLRVCLVVSHK